MQFAKKDIGEIAREMLGFFDEHRITHPLDFQGMIGHDYFLDAERFIEIRLRPSNLGTKSISCSYYDKSSGNPLNVRLNVPLGYYQIILKSVDLIEGYSQFPELAMADKDDFGNIPQYRKNESIEISDIKTDLESLARLA